METIIKFANKNKFDISCECRVKFSMKLKGENKFELGTAMRMSEFENSSEKTLSLLTDDNPKQYPIPVFWGGRPNAEKVFDCIRLFATTEISI